LSAIYDLLRAAMRDSFGGSVTRLSEACAVSTALGSRWVHEDERKRIVPSPASCQKIANGLGLDPDYVLELAGHRLAGASSAEPLDELETLIRARTAEMRDAVRDTPREFWATIIKATFDRAIDGARDMAHLLAQAEDRRVLTSADEAHAGSSHAEPRRRQRPIKPR
jgi:hypothetical protein